MKIYEQIVNLSRKREDAIKSPRIYPDGYINFIDNKIRKLVKKYQKEEKETIFIDIKEPRLPALSFKEGVMILKGLEYCVSGFWGRKWSEEYRVWYKPKK